MMARAVFPAIAIAGAIALVAGCAANRVAPHAKTVASEVSSFQAALSNFQDAMKQYQADEQARIEGTTWRGDLAAVMSKRLQVEWEIVNSTTEGEVFKALQTQGREELARLANGAAPRPRTPQIAFPLDKIGAVAGALDKLSQSPGTQADLKFLIEYGTTVNKQLKNIEKQSKAAGADAGAAKAK